MFDWITPKTVEILGNKKIVKNKGNFVVYVDNTEQSGPWVKKVWSKAPLDGKNVLILGFG